MRRIRAVGFDLGHTLIDYKAPLSWQSLYGEALKVVLKNCGIPETEALIESGKRILLNYNTRVNYREYEVSSDVIFSELFDEWGVEKNPGLMYSAKESLYGFFQNGCAPFEDTIPILKELKARGIKTGILTDVAYGMDNCFSLRDIEGIKENFDTVVTSMDVGFKKPNPAGFIRLMEQLGVNTGEMIFVGDEEKDVKGANGLRIFSVLLDREGKGKDFGQSAMVRSLEELVSFL